MNLPNKLTCLRAAMIPLFVFLLMYEGGLNRGMRIASLVVFSLACLTDMLDGKIARKYNLITNFGKFMDPLADKLLVCSALICFVELGQLPAWMVLIIVAREFIISGFRLVAAEQGMVIAAGMWGKFKTTFQMLAVIFLILDLPAAAPVTWALVWIAIALTIISLADYLYRNRRVMGGKI